MGMTQSESDRLDPVSIHIPQRKRPASMRGKQHRQPGWFCRGVWEAIKITVGLILIATVTVFGAAAWMTWQEAKDQDQFFRNDPFFNGQPDDFNRDGRQDRSGRDAHAFWNYQLDDQRPHSYGGER